ncbi:hypothetical protein [Paracoccus fistulariae]|uniref:Peptidase C51 domain-containing protein n=1 Tax=Paracoccus fistulariae TaxID=658446 RepID=A0ABY7SK81_9RHOB|nr:hypothetical protein [Paracoccus fistulariae]MDB6183177.1 hypothetical protein [Paracoccus fistulariae]WCR07300.1 hypothetical protein JHX87_00055 [Paracoccus fistulariae]
MTVSIHDLHLLVDTLESELATANATKDNARAADLQSSLMEMKVLRARLLIADAEAFATQLATSRGEVENAIARIRSKTGLSFVRSLAEDLGIPLPSGKGVHSDILEELPKEPPVASMDQPGRITTGGPSTFVAARMIRPQTILYTDDGGRDFLRVGGSRSWRNCNPGNIRKGGFSKNNGSIGNDGSFAIFPSKKVGRDAIEALLRGRSYGPLTLEAAINRYAPKIENDTDAYVDFVVQQTGLNRSDVLDELLIAQIRSIIGAIEKMEGWKPGEEKPHLPASGFAGDEMLTGGGTDGQGTSAAIGASEEWMNIARREAALPAVQRSEVPGPKSNPRILEYFRVGSNWFDPKKGDEEEWCAVFVNYCLEMSGHVGTNHPGARSFFWNRKNQFIRLPEPRNFSIGVRRYDFSQPNWETGSGHVGFVVDYTSTHVTLLGGNQSETITKQEYPLLVTDGDGTVTAKFVAFMMPVMN